MGTNALISLTRNGQTVAKIVSGCEGAISIHVARAIAQQKSTRVEDLYRIAQSAGLGCSDCLVVMDEITLLPADMDPLIVEIYRQHFHQPRANPRTAGGTVYYYYQIDIDHWYILSWNDSPESLMHNTRIYEEEQPADEEEQPADEEIQENICPTCGSPLEWEDCWNGCDDGYFDDLYDEDPLWYDEGDTEMCTVCNGRGGWWVCPLAETHAEHADANTVST